MAQCSWCCRAASCPGSSAADGNGARCGGFEAQLPAAMGRANAGWQESCAGSSRRKGLSLVLLMAMLQMFAACASSKPARFYVLSALPTSGSSEPAAVAAPGHSIGVGPVKIPDYLDRAQIVTRTTANALQLAEYDRWAEPLDRSLPRLLAENLGVLLPADSVVVFPWPGPSQVDYQVVIEVLQFDGTLGQKVWLEARWIILGEGGKQVLTRGNAKVSEPVSGDSHEALVSGWSKVLAGLSGEIASSLRTVSRSRPQGSGG